MARIKSGDTKSEQRKNRARQLLFAKDSNKLPQS